MENRKGKNVPNRNLTSRSSCENKREGGENRGRGWGVGGGTSPFREQIASGSSENAFIIREDVSMKIKIEIRKICKTKIKHGW